MPQVRTCLKCGKSKFWSTYGLIRHYEKCKPTSKEGRARAAQEDVGTRLNIVNNEAGQAKTQEELLI